MVIRQNCPWCDLQESAFQIVHERRYTRAAHQHSRQLIAACGGCKRWVMIDIEMDYDFRDADILKEQGEVARDRVFREFFIWPRFANTSAPDHTPEDVGTKYAQAMRALHRGDWDAAGMVARKALEIAVKGMPSATGGGDLKGRIDKLAAAQIITPLLAEWAHEIRKLGNDAAHDDFSEEEAREISEFAETFFEYAFNMPKTLEGRRAKAATKRNQA